MICGFPLLWIIGSGVTGRRMLILVCVYTMDTSLIGQIGHDPDNPSGATPRAATANWPRRRFASSTLIASGQVRSPVKTEPSSSSSDTLSSEWPGVCTGSSMPMRLNGRGSQHHDDVVVRRDLRVAILRLDPRFHPRDGARLHVGHEQRDAGQLEFLPQPGVVDVIVRRQCVADLGEGDVHPRQIRPPAPPSSRPAQVDGGRDRPTLIAQ